MTNEFYLQLSTFARVQVSRMRMRIGQAYMNSLSSIRPDLYDGITNTQSDCFYDDSLIPLFFKWLEDKE